MTVKELIYYLLCYVDFVKASPNLLRVNRKPNFELTRETEFEECNTLLTPIYL